MSEVVGNGIIEGGAAGPGIPARAPVTLTVSGAITPDITGVYTIFAFTEAPLPDPNDNYQWHDAFGNTLVATVGSFPAYLFFFQLFDVGVTGVWRSQVAGNQNIPIPMGFPITLTPDPGFSGVGSVTVSTP
jgi:hypothetical protein